MQSKMTEKKSGEKERETIELDENFGNDVAIADPIGALRPNLPVIRKEELDRMRKEKKEAEKSPEQMQELKAEEKSPGFFEKFLRKFRGKNVKKEEGVKNEDTDSKEKA